ncbi:MAG: sigma-70 family RNA polymerase sigma factor [Planctomycetes bacterium]|nr:sigma-70 family RNA polymerase sigma factor [Planctomycetota bacterium]
MEPTTDSNSFRRIGSTGPEPVTQAQARRFRQLAWPMLPLVVRTAQCLTRQADRAEDLAQETMIKAMRAIDTFQDGTDMKAWLLTILRRVHIDHLRSQRNRPAQVSLSRIELSDDSDDARGEFDEHWEHPEELMSRFQNEQVIEALHSLPDAIRWTLLLVDVEQLDVSSAAAVLEVPDGTIKSRAHRGRAMLRDRLYALACHRGWVAAPEKTS